MEALGATEGIEGDRGNYRHASLHDEFGPFNTRWKVDAPGGGTYSRGSGAFSMYWRSVVNSLSWKVLGISPRSTTRQIVCPLLDPVVRGADWESISMPHGRDHDHEW